MHVRSTKYGFSMGCLPSVAGWISAKSFFLGGGGGGGGVDGDRVGVHKYETKGGQYLAILTEQAWPINYLLYGKRTLFPCRACGQSRGGKTAPSRQSHDSSRFFG